MDNKNNFILDHNYADGNTPIAPEYAEQLIPKISTMAQLNEFEAQNILLAEGWLNRVITRVNPLDDRFLRALHEKMFDQVWKWAGTYRNREVSIGCDPAYIRPQIKQLLDDTEFWMARKTFPVDECAIRFHYRLVSKIHAFPNGNGRHARMMTDAVAVKHGADKFTWAGNADLAQPGASRQTYLTALRAMDTDPENVQPLLRFARS